MNSLELQKLVYGDRNIFLSKVTFTNNKKVSPNKVAQFIVTLHDLGYKIINQKDIFNLSKEDFKNLKDELFSFFDNISSDGMIFRKSFADSIELKKYTDEEYVAMLSQYSLSYGWSIDFEEFFGEKPENILKDFFNDLDIIKKTKLSTELKEFSISFNFEKDLSSIIKDILESKITLREQQIQTIQNTPIEILEKVFSNSSIIIKEIEVLAVKRLLESGSDINVFKDIDQIVRIIVAMYSYKIDPVSEKKYKVEFLGKIDNQFLKELSIKIPTGVRKKITKAIDSQRDYYFVIERMFKYYGFWKKIFTALRWESKDNTLSKFPNFMEIKNLLYKNDRKNTFNGRLEIAKQDGDYDKAINILSENPGYFLRNILEYLRYTKGVEFAKKVKYNDNGRSHLSYLENTYTDLIYDLRDLEEDLRDLDTCSFSINDMISEENYKETKRVVKLKNKIEKKKEEISKQKNDIEDFKELMEKNGTLEQSSREPIVLNDAKKFFKSKKFIDTLMKTNPKLLWHTLSLFNDEELFVDRTTRQVQNVTVNYDKPLPKLNKKLTKKVKKQLFKAIKKLKKKENKKLGKVFIDDAVKNYNVEFSGRNSKEIVLSGEYLSPGSKIPFSDLIKDGKILRLGIAWKGEKSCDIDHSLNLLDNEETVYYGTPTYEKDGEVIITSSGDLTENGNDIFSVELIDIDLDKAVEKEIGNMLSSAIQYRGDSFNDCEVLWFMNIIDKKNRIIPENTISLSIDKFQYGIQVNDDAKMLLGFYINLEEKSLEVLNISLPNNERYSNAEINKELFIKALKDRKPLIPMNKALVNVIKKKQIVDCVELADVVISTQDITDIKKDNIIKIHPSRNGEKITEIIF